MTKARVLVVDDEPKMAKAIASSLRRRGYACFEATNGAAALTTFAEYGADVVITDRRMPGLDGVELMTQLLEQDPELPVILVTAFGDVRSAVDAMRKGEFDNVIKPFDLDELRALVARALELRDLRTENRRLRHQLADTRVGSLVAESPSMLAVLSLVDRAAVSRATVLIQGESGTGKEIIARRVHAASLRSDAPFVAVNCKAFAAGVLESELFGHEKGAFTGADMQRAGCFERADGGTLFLDEIGEVDVGFQAKLLRVLQEGELSRVGGNEAIRVDVRMVAATQRDLRADIAEGRFREDLYYRLAVIPVHLPPLRERRQDILALAHHFLAEAARRGERRLELEAEAATALEEHSWPGNVRELQNVVERAVVLALGETVEVEDLLLDGGARAQDPAGEKDLGGRSAIGSLSLQEALDRSARERIEAALTDHDGRRAEAARSLGVDRTTLFRWMKRLGL